MARASKGKKMKKAKKVKKMAKPKKKSAAKQAKAAKPAKKVKKEKKVLKGAKAVKGAAAVKAAKAGAVKAAGAKKMEEVATKDTPLETVMRTMPKQIIKAGPEEVQDIPITSVMRKGVIVMDADKSVSDAARAMMRNRIGSIIVIERGKAVGIVTERDIVRKLVARDRIGMAPIKEIMSTPIRVIEEDRAVKDAVTLMKRYGIKRLPIMDKKKRLIGIVTDTDITSALPGMMDLLIELSKISRFEAGIESVGICNRCGMWSECLSNVQGEFLCDECKEEEQEEYEE